MTAASREPGTLRGLPNGLTQDWLVGGDDEGDRLSSRFFHYDLYGNAAMLVARDLAEHWASCDPTLATLRGYVGTDIDATIEALTAWKSAVLAALATVNDDFGGVEATP